MLSGFDKSIIKVWKVKPLLVSPVESKHLTVCHTHTHTHTHTHIYIYILYKIMFTTYTFTLYKQVSM